MTSLFARPKETQTTSYRPKWLSAEHVGNCCGAGWVCNWPNLAGLSKAEATGIRDQVKKDFEYLSKNMSSVSLVVLNHQQKAEWHDFLKENGYEPLIEDKYHTWRGNLLTLYGRARYNKAKNGRWVDTAGKKVDTISETST